MLAQGCVLTFAGADLVHLVAFFGAPLPLGAKPVSLAVSSAEISRPPTRRGGELQRYKGDGGVGQPRCGAANDVFLNNILASLISLLNN
jgi:hypothetical protein